MVVVAAGQLCSSSCLKENLATVVKLIDRAVKANAKVLFLPEATDYLAKNAAHSKSLAQPVTTSPFIIGIQEKLASLHGSGYDLHVSVGVHEPSNDGRVKNTLLYFDERGNITQRYQKIHLFDVDVANGPILRESESVEPGKEVLPPFKSPVGQLGLAICYDIRFPELAMRLRTLGAQVIVFPSAFTQRTGAAHWHLLGRARAIDTQCYVVMAAQSGNHRTQTEEDIKNGVSETKRQSYGHSIIVDPWGTILAEAQDIDVNEPQIITADINLSLIDKVRGNMPLWSQRRSDVFGYNV